MKIRLLPLCRYFGAFSGTAAIVMLSAVFMSSCTRITLEEMTRENAEIKVSSPSIDKGMSRTPVSGPSISSSNPFTSLVLVSQNQGSYSTLYGRGTITVSSTAKTAKGLTPAVYFPEGAGATPFYLIGLHPAAGWSFSANVGAYEFTGKEDVMMAKEEDTSYNAQYDQTSPAFPELSFKHLLTNLIVTVRLKDDTYKNIWGNLNSIVLNSPQDKVTVDLSGTAQPQFGSTGATTQCFYDTSLSNGEYTFTDNVFSSKNIPLTVDAVTVASSIVAPIDVDAGSEYELLVSTDEYPQGVPVRFNLTGGNIDPSLSSAGYRFVVNLVFGERPDEIQAIVTLEEWKDGGSKEIVV